MEACPGPLDPIKAFQIKIMFLFLPGETQIRLSLRRSIGAIYIIDLAMITSNSPLLVPLS